MAQTKSRPQKKPKVRLATAVAPAGKEPESEVPELVNLKNKRPIEHEIADEPVAFDDKEEKDEDGVAIPAEDAEEAATEEIGLDDEELNPFGDKWEQ